MGSRALIAKLERNGIGRSIYLGHGCYPDDAGIMLLEHYSEPEAVEALISRGDVCQLDTNIRDTIFYFQDYQHDWSYCRPTTFENGTEEFFSYAHQLGPEWLYAWTPDGWLAAKADRDPPENYLEKITQMPPEAFQDWFDNNQEPAWVEWRRQAKENQRPQPLATIIKQYSDTDPPALAAEKAA